MESTDEPAQSAERPKRKSISKRVRFEVFKRDGFRCRYCGRSSQDTVLHVDHIVPVCDGGESDQSNYVTACADCNQGKAGLAISEINPIDQLEREQLLKEQALAAMASTNAIAARSAMGKYIDRYYLDASGCTHISIQHSSMLRDFIDSAGANETMKWIDSACRKIPSRDPESHIRYMCGIRKAKKAALAGNVDNDVQRVSAV